MYNIHIVTGSILLSAFLSEFLVIHINIHWLLMPIYNSYLWGPSEREFWQRASGVGEATSDVAGSDEEGEWGQDGEGEKGAGKERKNKVRDVLYFINWAEGFNFSSVCGVQILNLSFWDGNCCHYHLDLELISILLLLVCFIKSLVDFKIKILCIK